MLDDFLMNGVDALLESVKAELALQRKNLEKQMIRSLVASQSYATAQNRKALTKETKKRCRESLKSASNSYKSGFSSSAKGQWVDAAKTAVGTVSSKFKEI